MNKSTEDSKIKQNEVIDEENTELTDEALEQVSGGVFGLKKEIPSYSRSGAAGKVNVNDLSFVKYVDT